MIAGPVRITSPFLEVKVGSEIFNVVESLSSSLVIVSTAGPVKIVVPSGKVVRTAWPLVTLRLTANLQS
jgi:hypothetical protein